MPDYLFVYGTLRKALVAKTTRELAALMKNLRFIGSGEICGQLYDLGQYPGAIVGENFATKICGEVYELTNPPEILAALDLYEGFIPGELDASTFARIKAPVTLSNGENMQCWLYVYNDWVATGKIIASGDYVQYLIKFGGYQHTENE